MKHQMMGIDGSLHEVAPGAYSHFANLMAGVLLVRFLTSPCKFSHERSFWRALLDGLTEERTRQGHEPFVIGERAEDKQMTEGRRIH